MSKVEAIPINFLQENQKDAAIEVAILRQGYDTLTKNGTLLRKLIFMDNQGTMIHGLIFASTNKQFEQLLKTNETCMICYPMVRSINTRYENVNPKFELLIQRGTTVCELQYKLNISRLNFELKEFNQLSPYENNKDDHNIIGVLKKVRPLINFTRTDNNPGYKREVVLLNTRLEQITINLWDDLALNEGQFIQRSEHETPVISFYNLKIDMSQSGTVQLKSVPTTAMLINPPCDATDTINSWLQHDGRRENLHKIWVLETIKRSKQVTLKQVVKERDTLTENSYYYITATIKEIENKMIPWYEACNQCFKAIIKTSNGPGCMNCVKQNIEMSPRYRISIVIEDEDLTARMTLFEEVAQSYIGCSVEDYIASSGKGKELSKYEETLREPSKRPHMFLFKLDKSVANINNMLSMIVEGVEKPNDYSTNAVKKKPTKSSGDSNKSNEKPTSHREAKVPKRRIKDKSEDDIDWVEIKDDESIADFNRRIRRRRLNHL